MENFSLCNWLQHFGQGECSKYSCLNCGSLQCYLSTHNSSQKSAFFPHQMIAPPPPPPHPPVDGFSQDMELIGHPWLPFELSGLLINFRGKLQVNRTPPGQGNERASRPHGNGMSSMYLVLVCLCLLDAVKYNVSIGPLNSTIIYSCTFTVLFSHILASQLASRDLGINANTFPMGAPNLYCTLSQWPTLFCL